MLRYLLISILPLFICVCSLTAQDDTPPKRATNMHWSAGFNAGMFGVAPTTTKMISGTERFHRTTNYGMGSVIDVEGKSHFALIANTSIGIDGGLLVYDRNKKGATAFEVELQNNKGCYSFNPPFLFSTSGDTFAKWVMTDKYIRYAFAFTRSFRISDYSSMGGPQHVYIRAAFGETNFHKNFNDPLVEGNFEDWSENGTGMKATTIKVNQRSWMLSTEIGLKNFNPDIDRVVDFGFVAHIPFKSTYTDQYEFFQNNVSVGKSNVTYHGSTFMLNLRVSFLSTIYLPPADTTKKKKPDVVVQQYDSTARKLDVQNTFMTSSRTVTIIVWDRNEIDGDKISLYLNNRMIKSNLVLKRRKKKIRVKLEPGSNYLVMYAENLGDIPPNTAAIRIKDGRKKKNITLSSDESKSGAIEIICAPK
ncbi:MAG: hypothetical protein Fur0041_04750 [Bacteroidia bacterium]